MYALAIPRFDAGAEGIHIIWAWPSIVPISIKGYDIQRISGTKERSWTSQCETIDSSTITLLRSHSEKSMPLGLLRLRSGAQFIPIDDPMLYSPPIKPHFL